MSSSSIQETASTSSKRVTSKDQPDSSWAFYFLMGTLGLGLLFMLLWLLTNL